PLGGKLAQHVRVDERPGLLSFEHGRQGHERKRERLLSWRRRKWVIEDDHWAIHTPKDAGARPRRSHDALRRHRHPKDPLEGMNVEDSPSSRARRFKPS